MNSGLKELALPAVIRKSMITPFTLGNMMTRNPLVMARYIEGKESYFSNSPLSGSASKNSFIGLSAFSNY
jgi:hypothetical protein